MKRTLIIAITAMLAITVAIGSNHRPVPMPSDSNDTVVVRTDTMKEIVVNAKKELQVIDAIRQNQDIARRSTHHRIIYNFRARAQLNFRCIRYERHQHCSEK